MKKFLRRAGTVVVAAAVSAAPAAAQTGGRGPSPASLGQGREVPATGQDLILSLDLTEAYDQDISRSVAGIAPALFQGSGAYSVLTPQLDFATRGGRTQVAATASSSARYYQDPHQFVITGHSVGVGLATQVTPQTSVSFSQSVAYSSVLFSDLFASVAAPTPGDAASPASNYALTQTRSLVSATRAGVTRKITERSAVLAKGGFRYDDFIGQQTGYADVRSLDAGGQFTYSLSRDLTLRLGYTFKQGQFAGSAPTTEHIGDMGVDYTRPLSRTRKTALTFHLGPTAANGAVVGGATEEVRRQYRLIGDATVIHQMGRTWSLKGTYLREMGYIAGFQSPVFTGAYAATASGLVNRRAQMTLSAAYSSGESALTGSSAGFTTYTGDARLLVALSSLWAVSVDYLFYYYDFSGGMQLPLGVAPGLTRNGVRAGLTMRVPVRHR